MKIVKYIISGCLITLLMVNGLFGEIIVNNVKVANVSGITLPTNQKNIEESPAPFIPPGWRYPRMDAVGHSCLERGSVVRTGNEIYVINVIQGVNTVLTGDVDGDGAMDIVTCSGSTAKIYDGGGNLKRSFSLPQECMLMMLEDVDSDGVMELFFGSGWASQVAAYVYRGDGTLLKRFVNQHNGYWTDAQILPIAFSKGKLIVGYNSGWAMIPRGTGAFDYASESELWYYQIGPISGIFSVADMDGDGLLDITMHNGTVHNGASGNGTTDGDLYLIVVNENGTNKITRKYESPSDGSVAHVFADLNNDGKLEIIGFKGHDRYNGGQSKIVVFNNSGSILKTFDAPMNRNWMGTSWRMGAYAVGDLDGNGSLEIVATAYLDSQSLTTTYVLDANLNKLAETSIDGEARLICDLNGDGQKEIVLVSASGFIRVLDKNLNQLSSYQVGVGGNGVAGDVIASDVNGDGKVELLCKSDALYILGFTKPAYSLIVKSKNPENGVLISSSTGHGGTTEYTLDVKEETLVNLEASVYTGSGANRKRFIGWSGSLTSANRSITFTMDTNKTLIANYEDYPETRIIQIAGDANFGSVVVNTINEKSIEIFNEGNMPLMVSSVSCPTGFSVTPQSFTIQPGSSQTVKVTFTPMAEGYYFGVITFISDKTDGIDYLACFGIGGGGITISPKDWNASANGGTQTVNISATTNWTISNPCSSWINVTPLSGSGNGIVTISVSANNSGIDRTCSLIIGGQTFTITQPAVQTPGDVVLATHEIQKIPDSRTNIIKCSVTYPLNRRLNSLLWRPSLPAGWVLLDAYGDGTPEVFNNEIVFIGSLTSNPVQFNYIMEMPEQVELTNLITGVIEYQLDGMINPSTIYATPNPLIYAPFSYHSADYREPRWNIDGTEVNRVLSYWREGAYYINPVGVDGYATVPGNTNGIRHSADYRAPFWKIDGTEVNRVLSYWRAMGYHVDPMGYDGYAPGQADEVHSYTMRMFNAYQYCPPIYIAGSTVSITNKIQYSGKLLSLLVRPILPDGWTIQSVSGNGNPELVGGEIVWTGLLTDPEITFVYTVVVPPNEKSQQCISAEIEYQLAGMVNPEIIKPQEDNLIIASCKIMPLKPKNNQITLKVLGKPNGLYRIEYSSDLLHWQSLTTLRIQGSEAQFSETMLNQFRFYRIVPVEE